MKFRLVDCPWLDTPEHLETGRCRWCDGAKAQQVHMLKEVIAELRERGLDNAATDVEAAAKEVSA